MIEGDNFVCECKGIDGNPPADVTWYKDNTKIGDTGKEKAILSLSNVGKDNNGTYTCKAKSGIEKAKNRTSINLIVNCEYNSCRSKYVLQVNLSFVMLHLFCSAVVQSQGTDACHPRIVNVLRNVINDKVTDLLNSEKLTEIINEEYISGNNL